MKKLFAMLILAALLLAGAVATAEGAESESPVPLDDQLANLGLGNYELSGEWMACYWYIPDYGLFSDAEGYVTFTITLEEDGTAVIHDQSAGDVRCHVRLVKESGTIFVNFMDPNSGNRIIYFQYMENALDFHAGNAFIAALSSDGSLQFFYNNWESAPELAPVVPAGSFADFSGDWTLVSGSVNGRAINFDLNGSGVVAPYIGMPASFTGDASGLTLEVGDISDPNNYDSFVMETLTEDGGCYGMRAADSAGGTGAGAVYCYMHEDGTISVHFNTGVVYVFEANTAE